MNELKIEYSIKPEELIEMYESVGWKTYTIEQTTTALKHTMYMVKVLVDDKIAGIGRVIGDFGIACSLTSICVKPEYQGKGIGSLIVQTLKQMIEDNVKEGEKMQIELCPTAGNEAFYQKAGFKYKPEVMTGMYLWIKK